MTGSGLTGNKVRKLEFLIADAKKHNADILVSCGGIQSNHCRATALTAARFGFGCTLLLRGEEPTELEGNLLIDKLAGTHIKFISEELYQADLTGELDKIASELKAQGKLPYVIFEGGSDPIGATGFVEAVREVKAQCQAVNYKPDRIICATGSGGTHAGLIIGTKIYDWDVEIVSVAVCYSPVETAQRVWEIVDASKKYHGEAADFALEDIKVIGGYLGEGYAKANDEVFDVITEMARSEGILLDPVYTGKAAQGLKFEAAAGRLTGSTLFWHTGGVFGTFPFRDQLKVYLEKHDGE